MEIQIRAKGIFLTSAMKSRIIKALSKLKKFKNSIAETDVLHVEVKHHKENMSRITAFIQTTKQPGIFKSDFYHSDFYIVLSHIQKDLERQIIRSKEMKFDNKRRRTKPGPELAKNSSIED